MMLQADYQKLQQVGVPSALLARLAVPALPSPSAAFSAPSPLGFPAAPLPTSAVSAPPSEPARQTAFTVLAPAYSLRLWFALREANKDGLHIALFEGLRTPQRQAWLYAQGRTRKGSIVTNARTIFSSWHGYGLAADCVFINSAGDWNWPDSGSTLWKRWYDIARKWGLTTGVYWKNPVDAPHTQPAFLPNSPTADDRSLLAMGGYRGVWQAKDQLEVSPGLFKLI